MKKKHDELDEPIEYVITIKKKKTIEIEIIEIIKTKEFNEKKKEIWIFFFI